MISTALLLALLSAQATPPSAVALGADVTVTAAKLRKLRLNLALADGRVRGCSPSVSSGDRFVDVEACRAADACVRDGVAEGALMGCIDQGVAAAVDGVFARSGGQVGASPGGAR